MISRLLKIVPILLLILSAEASGQLMDARDYFLLGSAKYKCQACDYAIKDFDRAIALDKKYADAYYGRALSWLCLKNYDRAVRDCNQAIRLNPDQALFHELRGRVNLERAKPKKAIADFSKAIDLDWGCWQAWYGWGLSSFKLNDYADSRERFETCLRFNPAFPMAWIDKAKLELTENKAPQAVKDLDEVEKLAPEYAPVFELRCRAKMEMEEYGGAIQDGIRAVELDPESSDSHYYLGKSWYHIGAFPKAEKNLESAVKLDKKFAEAWFMRAQTQEGLKELKHAQKYYGQAIRRDRKHLMAYIRRAELMVQLEKPKQAEKDLGIAISLDPRNLDLVVKRGELRLKMENYQGAINDFNKVVKIDVKSARSWFGLGEAKYQVGNVTGACGDWYRASQLGMKEAEEQMTRLCVK